eukprot:gene7243-5091_t
MLLEVRSSTPLLHIYFSRTDLLWCAIFISYASFFDVIQVPDEERYSWRVWCSAHSRRYEDGEKSPGFAFILVSVENQIIERAVTRVGGVWGSVSPVIISAAACCVFVFVAVVVFFFPPLYLIFVGVLEAVEPIVQEGRCGTLSFLAPPCSEFLFHCGGARMTAQALCAYEVCRRQALPLVQVSKQAVQKNTLQELGELDREIECACRCMFEENDVEECERRLMAHDKDIGSSFCLALLCFIRYVFSLKKEAARAAIAKVEAVCKRSAQSFSKNSFFSGILTVRKAKMNELCGPAEYRAKFLNAMSVLMLGLLQLTTRSLATMMKGLMTLRDGYKKLNDLEALAKDKNGVFDSNSVNGVSLGVGVFRTILSLLGPRMAAAAAMVGLGGGDYDGGIRLVLQCYESNTLYSPFAAVALLIIRSQRCASCPFICKDELQQIADVEKEMDSGNLSNSALHLWPRAKIKRLQLHLGASLDMSTRCLALTAEGGEWANAFASIRVNSMEDRALSLVIQGSWMEAYNAFVALEDESSWSRIVFVYCQACCLEMLLHERHPAVRGVEQSKIIGMITSAYWRAAHRMNIPFGARSKSVDAVVIRRIAEILSANGVPHPNPTHRKRFDEVMPEPTAPLRNVVPLPGYELLVFFSLCHQIPKDRCDAILTDIESVLPAMAQRSNGVVGQTLRDLVQVGSMQQRLSERSDKLSVNDAQMPEAASLMYTLGLKAALDAHSGACRDRVAASRLTEGVKRVVASHPMFQPDADTDCSLSYVLPLLEYSNVVAAYFSGEMYKCSRQLAQFKKRYKDRNFYLVEEFILSVDIAIQKMEKQMKAGRNGAFIPTPRSRRTIDSEVVVIIIIMIEASNPIDFTTALSGIENRRMEFQWVAMIVLLCFPYTFPLYCIRFISFYFDVGSVRCQLGASPQCRREVQKVLAKRVLATVHILNSATTQFRSSIEYFEAHIEFLPHTADAMSDYVDDDAAEFDERDLDLIHDDLVRGNNVSRRVIWKNSSYKEMPAPKEAESNPQEEPNSASVSRRRPPPRSVAASNAFGRIRVMIRCRPLLGNEENHKMERLKIEGDAVVIRHPVTGEGKKFAFDRVMEPEAGQHDNHGVLLRVIQMIFDRAAARTEENTDKDSGEPKDGCPSFEFKCSFLQLYNERITDLLHAGGADKPAGEKKGKPAGIQTDAEGLRLRWVKGDAFRVQNLFLCECDSPGKMRNAFFKGVREKVVASHLMNQQSSRSHCIFTIYVTRRDAKTGDILSRSEFSLVDLAGSEKLKSISSDSRSKIAKESIEINSSLLALGKVIIALANAKGKKGSSVHVPYRESKLTMLLKHAIGGNSLTTMIACISPSDSYIDETVSTMLYAGRAKNIENAPKVNEDPNYAIIRQLREEIRQLKEELQYYRVLAANGVDRSQHHVKAGDKAATTTGAADATPVGSPPDHSAAVQEKNELADSLLSACEMLKQIIAVNGQLREAYDVLKQDREEASTREMHLNAENLALRDRIEMLESIVLNDEFMNTTRSGHAEDAAEDEELSEEDEADPEEEDEPSPAPPPLRHASPRTAAATLGREISTLPPYDIGGDGGRIKRKERPVLPAATHTPTGYEEDVDLPSERGHSSGPPNHLAETQPVRMRQPPAPAHYYNASGAKRSPTAARPPPPPPPISQPQPHSQRAPPQKKSATTRNAVRIYGRRQLQEYDKRYRQPARQPSYAEYYGRARQPGSNKTNTTIEEMDQVLKKLPNRMAEEVVPSSLTVSGNFGDLTFVGSRNDVAELQQKRLEREEKLRYLLMRNRELNNMVHSEVSGGSRGDSRNARRPGSTGHRPPSDRRTQSRDREQAYSYSGGGPLRPSTGGGMGMKHPRQGRASSSNRSLAATYDRGRYVSSLDSRPPFTSTLPPANNYTDRGFEEYNNRLRSMLQDDTRDRMRGSGRPAPPHHRPLQTDGGGRGIGAVPPISARCAASFHCYEYREEQNVYNGSMTVLKHTFITGMAPPSPRPLRPPGTHTNEEVKEALHARARLRTYCIAALVVLLLAALAVIYNTAQEYENEEELASTPKMVLIVASELSFPALTMARRSEKTPFINELTATGGSFGRLNARYTTGGSALVKLLTGNEGTSAFTLQGEESILRRLKTAGFKPAIVAPSSYFSATAASAPGACPRIGILDTECVGDACPLHNQDAYCNADFKYATCEGMSQLYAGDVVRGFTQAAESGADVIYIQSEGIPNDGYTPINRPVSNMLERFSNMNLLDSAIGEIALALSQRTSTTNENWLIVLTSEGLNRYNEAPLFISAYSRGMIAQLNPIPATARTVDVFPTVLRWFGLSEGAASDMGICSNGIQIKNCNLNLVQKKLKPTQENDPAAPHCPGAAPHPCLFLFFFLSLFSPRSPSCWSFVANRWHREMFFGGDKIHSTPVAGWRSHSRELLQDTAAGTAAPQWGRPTAASRSASTTPVKEIVLDLSDEEPLTEDPQHACTDDSQSTPECRAPCRAAALDGSSLDATLGAVRQLPFSTRVVLPISVATPRSETRSRSRSRDAGQPDPEPEVFAPKFAQLFGSALHALTRGTTAPVQSRRKLPTASGSANSVLPPRKPLRYGWSASRATACPSPNPSPPPAHPSSVPAPTACARVSRPWRAAEPIAVPNQSPAVREATTPTPRRIGGSVLHVPVGPGSASDRRCSAKIELEPGHVIEVFLDPDEDTGALANRFIESYGLQHRVYPLIKAHFDKQRVAASTAPAPTPRTTASAPAGAAGRPLIPRTAATRGQTPATGSSLGSREEVAVRPTRTTMLRSALRERERSRDAAPTPTLIPSRRPSRPRSSQPALYERLYAPEPTRTSSARTHRSSEPRSSTERELLEHCTFQPRINRAYGATVWREPAPISPPAFAGRSRSASALSRLQSMQTREGDETYISSSRFSVTLPVGALTSPRHHCRGWGASPPLRYSHFPLARCIPASPLLQGTASLATMRRGIGVGYVHNTDTAKTQMNELGSRITAERVAEISDQLEALEAQLRTLSQRHKKAIQEDPVVRARFRQLADSLGLDLLSSQKNVFSGALGLGNFYYRLAGKVVECCMNERKFCGSYVPLRRVVLQVEKTFDGLISKSAKTRITEDDVVTALKKLHVLGSGYTVVALGGVTYIQTTADGTKGTDVARLLNHLIAQQTEAARKAATSQKGAAPTSHATAADSGQLYGAAYVLGSTHYASIPVHKVLATQAVALTLFDVASQLHWEDHRASAAVSRLVQDGTLWVDYPDRDTSEPKSDGNGKAPAVHLRATEVKSNKIGQSAKGTEKLDGGAGRGAGALPPSTPHTSNPIPCKAVRNFSATCTEKLINRILAAPDAPLRCWVHLVESSGFHPSSLPCCCGDAVPNYQRCLAAVRVIPVAEQLAGRSHPSSDTVILDRLRPHRDRISTALREQMGLHSGAAVKTPEQLLAHGRALFSDADPALLEDFGAQVVLSDLLHDPGDLARLFHAILAQLPAAAGGVVPWRPHFFTAVLQSLISLCAVGPGQSGGVICFGERRQLDRQQLGELAGAYMGHALRAYESSGASPESMDGVWSAFFVVCAAAQMAPKLLWLWWQKMIESYDTAAALPFEALWAVLAASADGADIERCLHVFREANRRGLRVSSARDPDAAGAGMELAAGTLTRRSASPAVQALQLRLLAKLMAGTKSVHADGGLREVVVGDLQRLMDPKTLLDAPWEVINDVLVGLSVSSAMQLVKARGSAEEGGDAAVPFMIWASLLRRCARGHHLDEAEALFSFIQARFSLSAVEKQELVAIVMRMYATLAPPDTASTLHAFLQHVVRPQDAGEKDGPQPDGELYSLLVKAADSRNAAMMFFLEGCAAGVSMSPDLFEALLGSDSHAKIRKLNRKLPFEYTSSKLDSMLRIPSNIDAHVRREEVQAALGKPIADSTGDCTLKVLDSWQWTRLMVAGCPPPLSIFSFDLLISPYYIRMWLVVGSYRLVLVQGGPKSHSTGAPYSVLFHLPPPLRHANPSDFCAAPFNTLRTMSSDSEGTCSQRSTRSPRNRSSGVPSPALAPQPNVAVPLITPRYQRKTRFYRSMSVTDSAPQTQTPGAALAQQRTESMTIQNGPIRYTETVHFHTYDLFRHGKSQIHSRSVGYSSDGDIVLMREDLSEVSDVDAITKRQTVIYEPTVLNPRAQAPLTDTELQSRYFRRFKKKYPGIRAPRNKKIRNRLMNDFFASEEALRIRDQAREFREEEQDETTRPLFGPLPPALESTFDVIRDSEVRAAERYWTPQQRPAAAPPDPDSTEARLLLLNTRLRAEVQRAFNSAFLSRQIEDLEATFATYIRGGDPNESLVIHFRDGYGRLVCHGIAAYYCLLSKTITAPDGVKLTRVSFPKGKKGVPHGVTLPFAPLLTALRPCSLPRYILSANTTPSMSPALEPVAPPDDLPPMSPLDLGESTYAAAHPDGGAPSPAAASSAETALENTTVLRVPLTVELSGAAVPLYEPQLYLALDDAEEGRGSFRIASQPPAGGGPNTLTQTQRKKQRKAEKAAQQIMVLLLGLGVIQSNHSWPTAVAASAPPDKARYYSATSCGRRTNLHVWANPQHTNVPAAYQNKKYRMLGVQGRGWPPPYTLPVWRWTLLYAVEMEMIICISFFIFRLFFSFWLRILLMMQENQWELLSRKTFRSLNTTRAPRPKHLESAPSLFSLSFVAEPRQLTARRINAARFFNHSSYSLRRCCPHLFLTTFHLCSYQNPFTDPDGLPARLLARCQGIRLRPTEAATSSLSAVSCSRTSSSPVAR